MASISANTFRVFAQKGVKYILLYYPAQVLAPEAGRTFEVSILAGKGRAVGPIRIIAFEVLERSTNEGRPPAIKSRPVHTLVKLALYHAVQKWEEENSIDQL